jgi:hypothetical protein
MSTIRSVPRAQLRLISGGLVEDCGPLADCKVTIEAEPIVDMDFDPTTCTKTETRSPALITKGSITGNLASASLANRARALLSGAQTIAAATAKVYTTPSTLAVGDIVSLGWLPAGSYSTGVFVPTALTTAVDSTAVTPDALVLDTDYKWHDAEFGLIEILAISGHTAPFVFTGNSRASQRAVMGDTQAEALQLLITAKDQRASCGAITVRAWQAYVEPGEIDLSVPIDSDESVMIPVTFALTPSATHAADTTMGRLGTWEQG